MNKNGGCKIIRQDMSQGQRYWLLRENYEWQVAYPLLDKGYVSLGFSDAGSNDKLVKPNAECLELLYGAYGNDRRYLIKFIDDIKEDDIVVVPFINQFNIYKVCGSVITTKELYKKLIKEFDDEKVLVDVNGCSVEINANNCLEANGKTVDLGFFRKIKLYAEIKQGDELFTILQREMLDSSVLFELTDDSKSHIEKHLIGKQEIIINGQHTTLAKQCLQKLNEKPSLVEQVKDYLKIIGKNPVESKDGFDAVATFDKVDTTVCVKVQQDNLNIKEWVLGQVKQFKGKTDIKQNNSMLWLITNESYCPELVKRLAGTGLKVDSKTDFEEVYLNALTYNGRESLYKCQLDKLYKPYADYPKCYERAKINNQEVFINKKNKAPVALVYPILFELQNVEYVKTRIKQYITENNIRYGVLLGEGFCSVIDKNIAKHESVSKGEIEHILNNQTDILTISKDRKLEKIKVLFSYLDIKIEDYCQYNEDSKNWCFKNDELELQFWDTLFENCKIPKGIRTYRYIPLHTLFLILENSNYRMCGLAGMNDISEINYFDEYCGLQDDLKETNQNDVFISSMCSIEDDLTMWRLYAEDATGVCLVFEPKEKFGKEFKLYKVQYADKFGSNVILDIIKNLIWNGVVFNHLSEWKHIFKAYEYNIEREDRLIYFYNTEITPKKAWYETNKNNIVNSAVDLDFSKFPLQLTKIILGPKCPEKEINIKQIKAMMQANNIPNAGDIEVVISSIDNYR
ncbi:MAG: DUF2971 domain-containing protein [Paludibacteraceae bacterium]|nr:DUF2971 domain-containing protein [Paludibacteraceae bacterium]